MTLVTMGAIGLALFVVGAWLMRQQRLSALDEHARASYPGPADFSDYLIRFVSLACIVGGALVFLGSMIGLTFSAMT